VRIGIVVSNAAVAAPTHTTVLLACAALARAHQVRIFEPWDFEVDGAGRLRGRAHVFEAPIGPDALVEGLASRDARRSVEVDRLDLLLLRANPFQDTIVTFAQLAQAAGVRVLNEPRGMVLTSHKGYLAALAGVPRPRTLVTRSRSAAERFASEHEGGVIVKPARSCGGRGVGLVRGRRRDRLEQALDVAMRGGDGYVVVQEYLHAARAGEKRLLWLDGALVGAYLRQRAPGDFRHNLKVGGQPEPHVLTAADHALAATVTPHLRRDGVWFAGLDVIGDHLVEVNALNPGGVHWSQHFSGEPIADRIVTSLEPPPARRRPTAPAELLQ
jgi:glutathione synthase